MANEPTPGAKPLPSTKGGASDDDIFAEMGRMLAQDQLAKPAPPGAGNDLPLELTTIVKPGKPQPAKPAAPAASPSPSPATAAKPAAPAAGTKIGDAVAMLDGQPKAGTSVTVSNRSLDSLVADLTRPMIQEWINKNLERIVREEIAKEAP